ncbi:MAG: galactosyl transferase GMA12/MNN10 family protein [Formosimonas sp.]
MPVCLTIAHQNNQLIIKNHQLYCQKHAYQHVLVDDSELSHDEIKTAWKYHVFYQHLRRLPENELLVLVNECAVFYIPESLEIIMAGRDFLVVDSSSDFSEENRAVQSNFMVARNTAQVRKSLFEFILFLHDGLLENGVFAQKESVGLRAMMGQHPYEERIAGHYLNVSTYVNWDKISCFVLNIGPLNVKNDIDKQVQGTLHNKKLNQVIVAQVNKTLALGTSIHDVKAYDPVSNEAFSVYNPMGKIAFAMLYTPNIAQSARITEHNLKRYCDLHGYALYVYRDKPAEIHESVYGNWLKPWVLAQHIEQHDWIFWVDSDVLVVNPQQKMETLLEGQDILLAKDLGGWHFNSGVMGFRHTPNNVEVLTELWHSFERVEDKSYVYSSQGDQFHIIEHLKNKGLADERNILDALSFNTPPALQTADSFMVHYMGQGEPWRTIHMAYDDEDSLRRLKPPPRYGLHHYQVTKRSFRL